MLARAGADVYDALLHQGVIIRPMGGFGLDDCVRISIGLPEENERLVKAIAELRASSAEAEAGA